jgi:hypothetical protein
MPKREGSIKLDLKEIWCEGVNWIQVAHFEEQKQSFWEHGNEPFINTANFLTS